MSSKEPITYFDYWFAAQNNAQKDFLEDTEKELAPYLSNIFQQIRLEGELPASIENLLIQMSKPTAPAWTTTMSAFLGGASSNVSQGFLSQALLSYQYKMAEIFSSLRIDAPTAATLWQRKKINADMYDSRMASQGFKPAEAFAFYESTQPYPTITDIIKWARYAGDPFNPKGTVYNKMEIDDDDFDMWEFLTRQQLDVSQLLTHYVRNIDNWYSVERKLARLGYEQESISILKNLAFSIPDPATMINSGLLNDLSRNEIIDTIVKSGVHPDYANKYINANTSKPNVIEIIEWLLRDDPELTGLDRELRRIGVNENYFGMYKSLAKQIPPIQDIITMAVREAFSPEIASRFGQYEDFPEDFALYAGKKGLTRDWSERYWAAHWSLPSPQQGFEMLHRGIITEPDLRLLLKSLDIMPFWRDKLMQMSYNTFTRVDVRRMYAMGVLTESQVKKSYLEMGYNEEKASQLTLFTVKQIQESTTGMSPTVAVNAYSKSLISESELRGVLGSMNLKQDDITNFVRDANFKKSWEIKDLRISAIHNQYRNRSIKKEAAVSQLLSIGIPSNETNIMLDKWEYTETKDKPALWTTAQTLSMLKKGIITQTRAITELIALGYDLEHRNALIATTVSED